MWFRFCCLFCCLWPGLAASAQTSTPGTTIFALPDYPGVIPNLDCSLLDGSIKVIGEDRKDLLITLETADSPENPEHQKQVKQAEALGLKEVLVGHRGEGTLDNYYIDISPHTPEQGVVVTLRVPRLFNLALNVIGEGSIEVSNVIGILEIDTIKGDIVLEQVGGNVNAHSIHGNVSVSLGTAYGLTDGGSVFSYSGKVHFTMPSDMPAAISVIAMQGKLFSDFDQTWTIERFSDSLFDERIHYLTHLAMGITHTLTVGNGQGPKYIVNATENDVFVKKGPPRTRTKSGKEI